MDRVGLIRELAEAALKRPLEACRPLPLSGWQAVEALWPLNDRFRPKLHMIRSIGYDPAHEREADQAIEALLLAQSDWGDVTANAWRVLLERQQQGLAVALLVERSGRPLMSVPEGLSSADRSALAVAAHRPHQWRSARAGAAAACAAVLHPAGGAAVLRTHRAEGEEPRIGHQDDHR